MKTSLQHLEYQFDILYNIKKILKFIKIIIKETNNIEKIVYLKLIYFTIKKIKLDEIAFVKVYSDGHKYSNYLFSGGNEDDSDIARYMNTDECAHIKSFLRELINGYNYYGEKDWSDQLIKDGIKSILEQDDEGIKLYNELKNVNIKELHEKYYEELMNEIKELS